MSIFTDMHVEIDGVSYYYSQRMHQSINKYARELYAMMGYTMREDMDFLTSQHPTERLMYSMALSAYIKFKRVRPSNHDK